MPHLKVKPSLPSGHASLQEAAKLAGVHPKTIRNWDYRKLVSSQMYKLQGKPPMKIYSIADIQREAGKQQGIQPRVEQGEAFPTKRGSTVTFKLPERRSSPVPEKLLEVLDGMLGRLEALPKLLGASEAQERDILTLDEAVARGYQRAWIRGLRKEGKLTWVGRGKVSLFDLQRLAGKQPGAAI